jgi:hypothetical protein
MTGAGPGTAGGPYRRLLQRAYLDGVVDGRSAAALGTPGDPDGTVARGRDPAAYAALLWQGQPGPPPSGLEANAVRWYATGFRDAIATIVPGRNEGLRCTNGSGSAERPTESGSPTPRTVPDRRW